MAARTEGAVVVLPGMAVPEAPVGPITSGSRVSWRPTWSEWARPDADEPARSPMSTTAPSAGEIRRDRLERASRRRAGSAATSTWPPPSPSSSPRTSARYLLPGATVVRREGRLFATVAVTSTVGRARRRRTPQAQRFAEAGFKVEWTSNAPLGV